VAARESFLHDVLSVANAAEHPVSDRERQRPRLLRYLARLYARHFPPACIHGRRLGSGQPASKAVPPAWPGRPPAELAPGLRVRRAADLRHHRDSRLVGCELPQPHRHPVRRLGSDRLGEERQPPALSDEVRRRAVTPLRHFLVIAASLRREPQNACRDHAERCAVIWRGP
jgi:hypothetical protein